MFADFWRFLRRRANGERRAKPRASAEKVQVVNRQYVVAQRLAQHYGTTPDELLDYRRADRILGERR